MSNPWLTIVGIGEDGLAGLSEASRLALQSAEMIFGGLRHLALAKAEHRGRSWPVPFDVAPVLACRGQKTVVLCSGDPFWHGAGGTLVPHLAPGEWIAEPGRSTFSLAAARLGWRLEDTITLGLHAAPLERLVPVLHSGARLICLVRDAAAALAMAQWLTGHGWGRSRLWLLSALGGPNEAIADYPACEPPTAVPSSPIAVAIEAVGGVGLPGSSGLADDLFRHDGQITKRPVRALALSALAPRPNELLWDIGAGSGSVSVEWVLARGRAIAIERRADRAANIRANAEKFGLAHSIEIVEGDAPAALPTNRSPDAIFIGGGLDTPLVNALRAVAPAGTRLVAHAVTLESESLLSSLQTWLGGELMRIDIAHAEPLGGMRSWRASRPVVQWSTCL